MFYCKDSFVYYLEFLLGGRFFGAFFCTGHVSPCILWGNLTLSSFLC